MVISVPYRRSRPCRQRWLSLDMVEENAIRLRYDERVVRPESRILVEVLINEIEWVGGPDDNPVYHACWILQRLCPVITRTFIDDIFEIHSSIGYIKLR